MVVIFSWTTRARTDTSIDCFCPDACCPRGKFLLRLRYRKSVSLYASVFLYELDLVIFVIYIISEMIKLKRI